MRLLAAAYPGAFAAVTSMSAVGGFHPHHPHPGLRGGGPPFPPFPFQTPVDQMAALDCSMRQHHQRMLQEETSARASAAAGGSPSGVEGMTGEKLRRTSPLGQLEMSQINFLDSPDGKMADGLMSGESVTS